MEDSGHTPTIQATLATQNNVDLNLKAPSMHEVHLPGGDKVTINIRPYTSRSRPMADHMFKQASSDSAEKSQLDGLTLAPGERTGTEEELLCRTQTPIERNSWVNAQVTKIDQPAEEILKNFGASQMAKDTTTNRRESSKPPPSSPPQYAHVGSFSTPTIPMLHQTSIPTLIEHYRNERRTNPEAFDHVTDIIHSALVSAKFERGGSPHLLQNEYTAELASRLDAETVEKWTTPGRQTVTDTEGEADQQESNTDTVSPSATFHLSDHVRKTTMSGSINHQTSESETRSQGGTRTFTRRHVIEINEVYEIAGDDNITLEDIHNARQVEDLDAENPIGSRVTLREHTEATTETLMTIEGLLDDVNKVDWIR